MADTQVAEMWPVAKHYYVLNIEGMEIAFQEVTGLGQDIELIESRGGDSRLFSNKKQPGLNGPTDVICKKGTYQGDNRLAELFQALVKDKARYRNQPRLEMTVQLLDELGNPIITWQIQDGYPLKYEGSDLKSDASEIAIETLTITSQGMEATYG
ncbi:MAG: phage tail protein [Chitinophagales bacterium]